MENTLSLFEKICGMLREMGFQLNILDGGQAVRIGLRDDLGLFDIGFQVWEEPSFLQTMVFVPMVIQEKSRAKVAELLVRANFSWPIGHLNLDMSTGFLHWSANMPIEDGDVTERQLHHLLSAGLGMMHRYFPAINRLIYSDDLSPAEAVAEVQMAAA